MKRQQMCSSEICRRLIDTHKDRIEPKGESYLTPAQRNVFEAITDLVHSTKNSILRYRDIKSRYKGGLLPSDFCYNLVNIGPDFEVKFLRNLERGKFEFVGFNWDSANDIKITWSPKVSEELKNRAFTVGYYRNGKYKWNFNELMDFL